MNEAVKRKDELDPKRRNGALGRVVLSALGLGGLLAVGMVGAGVKIGIEENFGNHNAPERPAPAVVPEKEPTTTTSTTTTTPEVQIGDPLIVERPADDPAITTELPDVSPTQLPGHNMLGAQEAVPSPIDDQLSIVSNSGMATVKEVVLPTDYKGQ